MQQMTPISLLPLPQFSSRGHKKYINKLSEPTANTRDGNPNVSYEGSPCPKHGRLYMGIYK